MPAVNVTTRRYRDERRQYVSDTIMMRMTVTEALEYLEEHGFPTSIATLARDKKKLESNKLKKLYHIAKEGFADQHSERIQLLEMAMRELFKLYREPRQTPKSKAYIISQIIALQPYISAYYESCKEVMETSEELRRKVIKHISEDEAEMITNKNVSIKQSQQESSILPSNGGSQEESTDIDPGTASYRRAKRGAIFDY